MSRYADSEERIAETLFQEYGETISNEETFNDAWINYMEDSGHQLYTGTRETYFSTYQQKTGKFKEFKKAKGKNLQRDRQHTAQKTTTSIKEYRRIGADKSDLEGVDTKPIYVTGKIKNKTVIVKPFTIKIKGKTKTVYRDSKGRFAKRIK